MWRAYNRLFGAKNLAFNTREIAMEITVQGESDGIVRISVAGGVTQKQLSQQDEILKKAVGDDVYSKKVVVSLQGNDFIDSSGINWLLVCHKRFIENQGRMVLHSIPQLVDSVLKILRMEAVFEIAANEQDAINQANSPPPTPATESDSEES